MIMKPIGIMKRKQSTLSAFVGASHGSTEESKKHLKASVDLEKGAVLSGS